MAYPLFFCLFETISPFCSVRKCFMRRGCVPLGWAWQLMRNADRRRSMEEMGRRTSRFRRIHPFPAGSNLCRRTNVRHTPSVVGVTNYLCCAQSLLFLEAGGNLCTKPPISRSLDFLEAGSTLCTVTLIFRRWRQFIPPQECASHAVGCREHMIIFHRLHSTVRSCTCACLTACPLFLFLFVRDRQYLFWGPPDFLGE